MRTYNEHDAVCDGCWHDKVALFCEWCSTFTCIHYSLEAGDDISLDGETVHRCNACETPLIDPLDVDRL